MWRGGRRQLYVCPACIAGDDDRLACLGLGEMDVDDRYMVGVTNLHQIVFVEVHTPPDPEYN
jgi:hypothetical protein